MMREEEEKEESEEEMNVREKGNGMETSFFSPT